MFVALLVTIPSTSWRDDAARLRERAAVVIGQGYSALGAGRSCPCLPSRRYGYPHAPWDRKRRGTTYPDLPWDPKEFFNAVADFYGAMAQC